MKELVVISGKGGTGKTSILAAFASLAVNKVLSDADVDAADLHLIMSPQATERHDFQAGHSAIINPDKCTACGLCRDLCRYNAISEDYTVKNPVLPPTDVVGPHGASSKEKAFWPFIPALPSGASWLFHVNRMDCEGCGVCVYFCPEKAVDFPVKTCGEWYLSETRFGPMVHARLGLAEENSGKLVTLVRQEARKVAEAKKLDLILTDGPPGIGCPVIASLGGASAALIVTEPTVAGRHDMERVAQLADFFRVPVMVCVNKADLNPESTRDIQRYAEQKSYEFLGAIPFDPVFTRAMVVGQTVIEYDHHTEAAAALRQIWHKVSTKMGLQTA